MKTIDQVAAAILRRVYMQILQDIPEPDCVLEKPKWLWKVEQVKKKVAGQLWPEGNGVNIKIEV